MHLFLTGSTGFVGSWLLRHFAAQGCTLLASGRSEPPPALLALARYQRADICRPLPKVEADAVLHAAALASDSAPFSKLLTANVEGTKQVFWATRDCPVFIYISSSSVYEHRALEHRENEPVQAGDNPGIYPLLSPYGHSKRLAEDWLLQQDWSRRSLIILRPRAVYGPGDRQLLPRMLRLVRGGRIFLPGDMRIPISLTYAGNLAKAVQLSLDYAEKQAGGAHIFNVADEAPYELRDITSRLLSVVYGRELPVLELPLPAVQFLARVMEKLPVASSLTRFGLDSVSQPCLLNLDKTRTELAYQASVNFWEVLPDIRDWAERVGLGAVRAGRAELPWTGELG